MESPDTDVGQRDPDPRALDRLRGEVPETASSHSTVKRSFTRMNRFTEFGRGGFDHLTGRVGKPVVVVAWIRGVDAAPVADADAHHGPRGDGLGKRV